jgi:hypothetical protein
MGLWRPAGEPLPGIDDLARLLSISPDTIATMSSSTKGRLIVGFAAGGALQVVAKVGGPDDHGLRREGAFVQRLARLHRSEFDVSKTRWVGEWRDRYVVAVEAHEVLAQATPADALRVAIALAQSAGDEITLTHGDFAPWNLARTAKGLLLLDWEEARTPCEPLVDLTHFVLQSGSLLGMMDPDTAMRRLTAPGELGWQYLEAIGGDPRTTQALVIDALGRDAPGRADHRTLKFRHAMLRGFPGGRRALRISHQAR